MVFEYAAAVINQYTAGYPSWVVISASAAVVVLSWLLGEMGVFSKSKFVVKDKVRVKSSQQHKQLIKCHLGRTRAYSHVGRRTTGCALLSTATLVADPKDWDSHLPANSLPVARTFQSYHAARRSSTRPSPKSR